MTLATRMTLGGALLLAAAAGGIAAAAAQDAGAPAPAPVTEPPPAEDVPAEKPRFSDAVEKLGDPDFEVRTRAYEELKAAGKDALPALRAGSRSKDAQVQWASRRLLGLIGGGEGERRPLTLRFEEDPKPRDVPAPDVRVFDDETFHRTMEELRRRMAEVERGFSERAREMEARGREFAARLLEDSGTAKSEAHVVIEKDGERTEFRRDAEGRVKVTLTKKGEDGQEKTETFEAESLDALAKEHPEVHARVRPLAGGGLLFSPGWERFQVRIPEIRMPEFRTWAGNVDEWTRSRDFWRDGVTGARPVLGVGLSPVPPVLRSQCGIAENEGVVVESVIEGSLAARIALQKHDVILAVNGLPVSSSSEVRSAVEAVKEGAEVRLTVLRAGKHHDLTGTR